MEATRRFVPATELQSQAVARRVDSNNHRSRGRQNGETCTIKIKRITYIDLCTSMEPMETFDDLVGRLLDRYHHVTREAQ